MSLTPRERAILDFERDWRRHEGSKESRIRDELELSSTRYYQLLNRLLELPEAEAHDPLVVRRLRRERSRRRQARFEGRPSHQTKGR